jgi:drug/metabolite transporter (DMT)-like permease
MSSDVALGFAVALVAAACYETSYAMQALEARAVDRGHGLRPSLLVTLARRPRWAAAIALGVGGWLLQVLALGLAPLTLVQPAIASGLILLLYLGVRLLGERVTSRDVAAAAAIVAGVAGIAVAAPARVDAVAGSTALVATFMVLGAIALAPYVLRAGRGRGAWLLVAAAGAADAGAAVSAKLVSDDLAGGRPLVALAWAAGTGVAILFGLLSETTALQRLPATRVAPLVLVIQVTVPVILAPLVVGESWSATPLHGGLIAASLALVAAGTVALAASSAVADLIAPDAGKDDRGRRGQLGE